MTTGCTYNAQGCLVCPALPAVPGSPPYTKQSVDLGWNAGANSVAQLDGDIHTVFGMPVRMSGALLGFKASRDKQTIPQLIPFGLYFYASGNTSLCQVSESGSLVPSTLADYVSGDTFEIRRVAGVVTYWKNGSLLYTSPTKSYGSMVVNACLYASGDTVGSA